MTEIRRRASFKIVVRKIERPFSNDIREEFNWICQSLGFFEPIDKEKTASAIFKAILDATEQGNGLSSNEIAQKVNMSRGAIINHLNRLLNAGLIVKTGHFYVARSKSVYRLIQEIEEDIDRVFARMKDTAREIDEQMGLQD